MIRGALDAARVLAAEYGLVATEPVVLHAGSNIVVRLSPAPVVVRVMTGTAMLHADPAAWLAREVSVCAHLVRLGAAVIAPSEELPPGPHYIGGLWMTCWEHVAVDHDAPAPPADELGRALGDLHAALSQVPVDLEPQSAVRDELAGLIDRADHPLAHVWRAQLADLPAEALQAGCKAQPIHGDASLHNLLTTTDGQRLWADFEDVRRGPVEADVAGLIDAARNQALGAGYEKAVLSAYGPVDAEVLDAQLQLHALYGAAWRARPRAG